MKKIILIFLLIATQSFAAQSTIKDSLKTETLADGTERHFIDFSIMDQISDRIAIHAREYPPTFKNSKQEKEVKNELEKIFKFLDVFVTDGLKDPSMLIRIGFFHSMGHNLDFSGSAEKAIKAFEKLLKLEPNNPRGNYLYGMFLSSTEAHYYDSIKYLEKALELGVTDAKYTLGLIYLRSGKTETGVKYLEEYSKQYPKSRAVMILKAYKEGRLNFSTSN